MTEEMVIPLHSGKEETFGDWWVCNECGYSLLAIEESKYCGGCGKKIDWTEEEKRWKAEEEKRRREIW